MDLPYKGKYCIRGAMRSTHDDWHVSGGCGITVQNWPPSNMAVRLTDLIFILHQSVDVFAVLNLHVVLQVKFAREIFILLIIDRQLFVLIKPLRQIVFESLYGFY